MLRIICKYFKYLFRWKTWIYATVFADILLISHFNIFGHHQTKPRIVGLTTDINNYRVENSWHNCSTTQQDYVGLLKMPEYNANNKNQSTEPFPEERQTHTTDNRGRWFPKFCQPRQRTFVIVPFRDRDIHLKYFIEHFIPILQRQLLDYTIIVVEQDYTQSFNRGMLFNIGYREALSLSGKNSAPLCLILHDVDLLLEDDRVIYECSKYPTHFSVGVDKFEYRLPYGSIFGGVVGILGDQFNDTNGFSNIFFGWGGEDDDFRARLISNGFSPVHYQPQELARYTMLGHDSTEENEARMAMLETGYQNYNCDGLNSLDYTVTRRDFRKHYISIKINLPIDLKTSSICENCLEDYMFEDVISHKTRTLNPELLDICHKEDGTSSSSPKKDVPH